MFIYSLLYQTNDTFAAERIIGKTITSKNHGVILERPKRSSALKGLPFRSLFFVPELNVMYHEVQNLPEAARGNYAPSNEQATRQVVAYLDVAPLQ